MRIVIDLQAAQTGSRFRGIGRHALSLVHAMARCAEDHEIILLLNGLLPDAIMPIRTAFAPYGARVSCEVFDVPDPTDPAWADRAAWHACAARVREHALLSLQPDAVLITSLFETDPAVVVTVPGVLGAVPTAVIFYDLIPYLYPEVYLKKPRLKACYFRQIEALKQADVWWAIAGSVRKEGVDCLGLPVEQIEVITPDAEPFFKPAQRSRADREAVWSRYGLTQPFVMTVGGGCPRKNIPALITAYSKLPDAIGQGHQLLVVCALSEREKARWFALANKAGLPAGALVLPGHVPDDDLCVLYQSTAVFVFPSWHEGFGLPVLEAMRCGAPVIGANTTSVPEVIDNEAALFDPFSVDDMAALMTRALTEAAFRQSLVDHARLAASRFCWDRSGQQAMASLACLVEGKKDAEVPAQQRKPRLAYVSPLPPIQSGIAEYSVELLPHLAAYYTIDVIVDQDEVIDPWVQAHCGIRSADWLRAHSEDYDHVLYHMGNSEHHAYQLPLLETIPGVVVLHDFFLSRLLSRAKDKRRWQDALRYAHGYQALGYRRREAVKRYPCSLEVIESSLGVVVHSQEAKQFGLSWYGLPPERFTVVPLLRDATRSAQRAAARAALGVEADAFLVCAFGRVDAIKLNDRLLFAFSEARLSQAKASRLVFVGAGGRKFIKKLRHSAEEKECSHQVSVTGWVSQRDYQQYLAAADLAVQLRTDSRGESSGAVLDCLKYSLPTIVNACGSLAELHADAVCRLPAAFSDAELAAALDRLWQDETGRTRLGAAARDYLLAQHDPARCAAQYHAAMTSYHQGYRTNLSQLLASLSPFIRDPNEARLLSLSQAIAHNTPRKNRRRQLLLDVSAIAKRDIKTGIERVVRAMSVACLAQQDLRYSVALVSASGRGKAYRYAHALTHRWLGLKAPSASDDFIDYAPGDVLLVLDLCPLVSMQQRFFYQRLRQKGVRVYFVVHDLLPVTHPAFFLPNENKTHPFLDYLHVVSEADGAVCISKATAQALTHWLAAKAPDRLADFDVQVCYLAGDIANSVPTDEMPNTAPALLDRLSQTPVFLMVGTLEPRKGHADVLAAFDQLWAAGVSATLVIVGKEGWLVHALCDRLRTHPEQGKQLHWLSGISDAYLEAVYARSEALIAASVAEGFGLPLIEAAQKGLPVIARDIPVFKEVLGDYGVYFDGDATDGLVSVITDFLSEEKAEREAKRGPLPFDYSWETSAARLADLFFGE
jgi:glycosyltransferase involved in cell wall biosynthesis